MKRVKLWLLIALAGLSWACEKKPEIKRPRDPWVFRSVLNSRPRMITVALNDRLWTAYDATHCGLYMAWLGGVNFDGAVYNTRHGPQPTSKGSPFTMDSLSASPWRILKNDQETMPKKVIFKGYVFKDKQVSLQYELETEDGKKIGIKEKPEFFADGKKSGLVRVFETSNVPDGLRVGLKIRYQSLGSAEDLRAEEGEWKISGSTPQKQEWGETQNVEGIFVVKSNGKSTLSAYFDPRVSETKAEEKVQ
jgi:cytochrome c